MNPVDATHSPLRLEARIRDMEQRLTGSEASQKFVAKGLRTSSFSIPTAIPGATVLPFDSANIDTHSAVNLNGTITLPFSGTFTAVGFFTWPSTSPLADLFIYSNNSMRLGEQRQVNTTATMATVSAIWKGSAGDTIQLIIGQNSGATMTATGNATIPWYLAVASL